MAVARSYQGRVAAQGGGHIWVYICHDRERNTGSWIELESVSVDGDRTVVQITLEGMADLGDLFTTLAQLHRVDNSRLARPSRS